MVIGPGAVVRDSYIGPYSSIGADTVIEGTEIEHSIVLPRAELRFVGTRIESSVIGRGARIVRSFRPPGDHAHVARRRCRGRHLVTLTRSLSVVFHPSPLVEGLPERHCPLPFHSAISQDNT